MKWLQKRLPAVGKAVIGSWESGYQQLGKQLSAVGNLVPSKQRNGTVWQTRPALQTACLTPPNTNRTPVCRTVPHGRPKGPPTPLRCLGLPDLCSPRHGQGPSFEPPPPPTRKRVTAPGGRWISRYETWGRGAGTNLFGGRDRVSQGHRHTLCAAPPSHWFPKPPIVTSEVWGPHDTRGRRGQEV